MTDQESRATLAITLMAAFADGSMDDGERDQLRRIAGSLPSQAGADLPALHEEVLKGKRTPEGEAAALSSPEARRQAYELAVAVCDADGARSDAERRFLERLAVALGLEASAAAAVSRQSEALATLPVGAPQGNAGTGTPPGATPAGGASAGGLRPDAAALDEKILSYSILNGALELLPESLATMAIIPLQMKLVYEVGQAHGYALDQGHVKELLATVGVGLTSQAFEQVGRKLLGGLLGRLGGGLLGGLGRQATSTAFAFASTYALGQVAKAYYSSGRSLDGPRLREVFDRMLGEARALAGRYTGQIEEKARTIDPARIVAMVRGS
jgi:tellurite resistance protein/uncharacterized protein (DUF697 family)